MLDVVGATATLGPKGIDLGEDPLPELVPGAGERERGVRVEALETTRISRPRDAQCERLSLVFATAAPGKLASHPALLVRRPLE